MTETTQEERTQARQKWIVSQDVMHRLARDADRLARLEDGIRQLADAANAEAESCRQSSEGDSGYEAADALDGYAKLMRALLDGE